MNWIFDHIWLVVAIAGVIAKMMQAARSPKPPARDDDAPRAKEYEFEDPQLAERTRKIREEIQRKIEQRRGQHLQPAVPQSEEPPPLTTYERPPEATTPPVTLPEILREVLQPKPAPVPSATRAAEMRAAEEAERQAALEEQLRDAEQMKAAAQRRAAFEATLADTATVTQEGVRTNVLDDLRDPAALRRAFILREVLGPPMALR